MNTNLPLAVLHRRHLLQRLGAVGLAAPFVLLAGASRAADPVKLDVRAERSGDRKLRVSMQVGISLPDLRWSGPLGPWDVPVDGERRETVSGPDGWRFAIYMRHLQPKELTVEIALMAPRQSNVRERVVTQAVIR